MNLASNIKKEIFEIPDLLVDKTSNYNANVYMDKCIICNYQPTKLEIPLETHHIVFQKDFIKGLNKAKPHLRKNHKSNLVVLCTKCHDKIDNGQIMVNGWLDTNKLDWSNK